MSALHSGRALEMHRASNAAVRSIVVNWIDEATVIAAATKNGWTVGASLADYVNDINDYDKVKAGFASVTKAKDWARRNKHLDVFGTPEVIVYEWPNYRKFAWERECVRLIRYLGDGMGWEELEVAA